MDSNNFQLLSGDDFRIFYLITGVFFESTGDAPIFQQFPKDFFFTIHKDPQLGKIQSLKLEFDMGRNQWNHQGKFQGPPMMGPPYGKLPIPFPYL